MIHYKDQAFCADAEKCANKYDCRRWFSPAESIKANKWWGCDGAPVAFAPRKDRCDRWEENK